MLLKVVFDKTVIVKFQICGNFKQNVDETHSKHQKNLYQPMDFKISREKSVNQKSREFCQST